MEVTNPGGIYHYELIDILHGAQSFRNPKLVNILNKLSFIENYAEGIKRIREAYPDYDVISFFSGSSLWFRTTLPDLNYVKYGDKPIDGPKMAPMNEPKKFCINRWSN